MKALFILILLTLGSFCSHAQVERSIAQTDIDFINSVIRDKRYQIFLVSETKPEVLEYIREKIGDGIFIKRYQVDDKDFSDTLSLSKHDIESINKQFESLQSFKWSNNWTGKINLDRLKIIPADSSETRSYYGAIRYRILPPIFFHSDQYCLFYYDYNCDTLCGFGFFGIFIKQESGWKLWKTIFRWVS